jgi:hypothetical protein
MTLSAAFPQQHDFARGSHVPSKFIPAIAWAAGPIGVALYVAAL